MRDSAPKQNFIQQQFSNQEFSPCDVLTYQEFSPCNVLAEYIYCYWIATTPRCLESVSMTRIIPDGCIELIFNLGGSLYQCSQKTSRFPLPSSFVVGAMKASRMIEMAGCVGILGVRFKPGGAVPFFRVSAQRLTNRIILLEDILDKGVRSIGYRLVTEPTDTRKIAALENFLLTQLADREHRSPVIQQATRTIIETRGQIPIKALETSLMISRRQLERKFLEAVGLSPKIYCRIIRMYSALCLVLNSPKPIWADIVYASGFYDQAHFIRECKSLIGLPPSVYLREQTGVTSQTWTIKNQL